MKLATPNPTPPVDTTELVSLPVEPPGASVSERPVFVLDAEAGLILDGNAPGWAVWGVEQPRFGAPLALDHAMPALRHLLSMPCARMARTQEILTFWTPAGVSQARCAVRRTEAGKPLFIIEMLSNVAGSASTAAPRVLDPQAVRRDDATRRLAHELRTPLSAVIAYAEVLKEEHFGAHANARYREYARNIYDSARHALGVVDGMLSTSRPAASGVPELIFADLDPRTVVEDCLAVARPLAEHAGLELACALASRIPRIVADEVSLKQMLLNLLTNAIKFARAGDQVTVSVAYELGGPLRITVADTGPGMCEPPLALEGGKGTSRPVANGSVGGHGIGLPLTRALAEANGAAMLIDSAPGRGTEVTITFPKDRVIPV